MSIMTKIRNTGLFVGVVAVHVLLGWWLSQAVVTPPDILDEDGQGLMFVGMVNFQSGVKPDLKPARPPQHSQPTPVQLKTTTHHQKQDKLLTAKTSGDADVLVKKPVKEKTKEKVKKKSKAVTKKTTPVKQQDVVKKEVFEKNTPVEKNDTPVLNPVSNVNAKADVSQGSSVVNENRGQSKHAGQGQGVTGRNQGASVVKASASSCTPNYPDIAKENEEEGVVTLTLTVTPTGRTSDIKILQTSGFSRLDRSALHAMKRCLFNPALKNGKPVAWAYTQKIRFSLDDERATLN